MTIIYAYPSNNGTINGLDLHQPLIITFKGHKVKSLYHTLMYLDLLSIPYNIYLVPGSLKISVNTERPNKGMILVAKIVHTQAVPFALLATRVFLPFDRA